MEPFSNSLINLKHLTGSIFSNLSYMSFIYNNNRESLVTVRYKRPATENEFTCYTDNDFEQLSSSGGYIYDVLQTLEETTNIRINYEESEYAHPKDKAIGNTDLFICHPLTGEFPPSLDVVFPVLHSRLVLLYKSSSLPIEKDLFIRNINGNVWYYLVAVLILLTICFRLSTFIHHSLRPSHRDWTWMEVVQWSLGAVCQQGSAKYPQGCSCRTMFVIGYLITYMIFTGYAAGITSLLAVRLDSQHLHWNNAVQLQLQMVELCNSSCQRYLMHDRENAGSECAKTVDDLLVEVEHSAKAALVSEASMVHFLTHSISEEMRCKISFAKQPHHSYYTALAISKHSQLKHSLYYWLLRLKEHGLLNRMLRRSLNPLPVCQLPPGYTEVGFEHVSSAFYIFIIHMIGSFLLLILEILLHRNGGLVDNKKLKNSKLNKKITQEIITRRRTRILYALKK